MPPSASRPEVAAVPVFQLYGEASQWLMPDLIHVESIAARSRLHNWEIKPHRHHGLFQLLWLHHGEAQLHLDGEGGVLEGGRVMLIPQQSVHGFRFSPDARGMVITIACPLLVRLGIDEQAASGGRPRICRLEGMAAQVEVEALLRALEREYAAEGARRGLLLESLAAALLVWLLRAAESPADAAEPARARRYLEAFSAEVERSYAQHQPVSFYAAKLGISAAHLNAICRRLAQQSALEMIHARLMLEARRNLVYTSMSVQDIADALGFNDPAYFTRFFRRHAGGLAPRDFRLQALSAAVGR